MTAMAYVQGFVIPVSAANRDAYLQMVRDVSPIFLELGALRVVETWGVDVADGHTTDFRRAVAAEADEAIVFSWIVWPDRATCDAAQPTIVADPRMAPRPGSPMPFDGRRMIFGGFETIFDTGGGG